MRRVDFSFSSFPLAYLITISCYGIHLQGHPEGSVDRRHNRYGQAYLAPNPSLERYLYRRLAQRPYKMDQGRREVVLGAIQETCLRHDWSLLAAHVRSTHLHAVVQADQQPEKIMAAFKSQASQALTRAGFDSPNRKRWTRNGSRKYLWDTKSVAAAIEYVLEGQGEPMSVFTPPDIRD